MTQKILTFKNWQWENASSHSKFICKWNIRGKKYWVMLWTLLATFLLFCKTEDFIGWVKDKQLIGYIFAKNNDHTWESHLIWLYLSYNFFLTTMIYTLLYFLLMSTFSVYGIRWLSKKTVIGKLNQSAAKIWYA